MTTITVSLTAVQAAALGLAAGDIEFWASSVVRGRAEAAIRQIVEAETARLSAAGLPIPATDAEIVLQAVGAPPAAPTEADYARAIQSLLDETARARRYDGMQTAVSYRGDANPQYAGEAEALFAWRSAIWTYATAELGKVQAGERAAPTIGEFLAELPPFSWPEA